METKEWCDVCDKLMKMKFQVSTPDGFIEVCSKKCAKGYILDNISDYYEEIE